MINEKTIVTMINHWLATPPNGYFYQGYGNNLREQLLKNMSDFSAQSFLQKLKADIPLLQQIPSESLNIVSQTQGFDSVLVYIQIGSILIELGRDESNTNLNQDYYDVTAR